MRRNPCSYTAISPEHRSRPYSGRPLPNWKADHRMPARKRHRQTSAATTLTLVPTAVWEVNTVAAVPGLVEEVLSPSRYRPLVVVSKASDTGRSRVDVEALAARLDEHANVAVIDLNQTNFAFNEQIPDAFCVYGGAVRLCWPYATSTDTIDQHPLFLTRTEADSAATIDQILRCLSDAGYLTDPDTPAPEDSAVEDEQQPEPVPTDPQVDRLNTELARANNARAQLAAENTDLRKTVRSLSDQIETLQQRLRSTAVYSDPDQQLRHEIEYAYLHTYTEADRRQYPLASYTFGPDFLISVETLEGIERDKVVSACVDVLTRRAWQINGRKARQLRAGPGGSPYQVRASDNAAAWRCNLQTGTASARRLMWWEIPDGTIELALVAVHDDVSIR